MPRITQFSFKIIATITLLSLTILLCYNSTNYAVDWWPFGEKRSESQAPIELDPSPLNPEIKAATSIAPMIKKVSPSVVNVFSTKISKGMNQMQMMPFFSDPFFRRFFGDPDDDQHQWKPRDRKEQSLGSGVIVTRDGYILTNNHVIENADEVHVAFVDSKKEYPAKVIGMDPKTDIAVLKIEAQDLPAITFGDSNYIEVGDYVVAIGNPFGVGQTVTSGIVSAIGRGNIGITDYEDFIQTDASINPGNSGGALVDAQGRLIGINTAIISRSGGNQGIGFAVPINLAKMVMKHLLNDGRVARGFLGVMIQEITQELAENFTLPEARGALVSEVTEGSPAEKAGIKNGDVIIKFNGKNVDDVRHLRLMVAEAGPNNEVTLTVLRDGQEVALKTTLTDHPGNEISGGMIPPNETGTNTLFAGIAIDNLNSGIRQKYGLPSTLEGVVVIQVEPNAPAYQYGLREGDVIIEINRVQVKNREQAFKVTRKLSGNSVLLYVWSNGSSRYLVIKDK